MSRNRVAILADIEQFNLDPTVAHGTTHANGRLAKAKSTEESKVETSPVEEKKALESVPTTNDEPVSVVTDQTDEPQVETELAQVVDEPKVEATTKKKGKKQPTE